MTNPVEALYQLLPSVHRLADARQGEPLRQLLDVIELQLAALQEDVELLYDDQFIETSAEWVTPYIGDLIGYRPLNDAGDGQRGSRAEVANTIFNRRRKGTITVLEQLARDVTAWDAVPVEYFKRLITTVYMNHLRRDPGATVSLRDWEGLLRASTAFDDHGHTADVRNIASGRGRYNIPNVGIYLWRLSSRPLTRSPAVRLDAHRYLFSPLGNDLPLVTRAEGKDYVRALSEPIDVPDPIRYRVMAESLDAYYGQARSVFLEVDGVDTSSQNVRVCHLGDAPSPPAASDTWARSPLQPTADRPQRVAVDPELGRIVFADPQPGDRTVFVTFHQAFGLPIGGGEYARMDTFTGGIAADVQLTHGDLLQPSLDAQVGGGVIEVVGSARFEEDIRIEANGALELRGAEGSRPIIAAGQPIDIELDGGSVTLNGFVISGGGLNVTGRGELVLRHCTLVPGLSLERDGQPADPGEPSIVVNDEGLSLAIEQSIVGPVLSHQFADIDIEDSIVDATDWTGVAYAALDAEGPGGAVTLENVTVVGKLHSRQLVLASNTVFAAALGDADAWTASVRSTQTQNGCVRYSYVPPGSVTPRRHRCQPDIAIAAAEAELREREPLVAAADVAAVRDRAAMRVRPSFSSRRYGTAAYLQLSRCNEALLQGADDESEMGVYHDAYAPQKVKNLKIRLEEYLRFRLEAGVFFSD